MPLIVDQGYIAGQAMATQSPDGMAFIPGGTFRMGSDRHYPEEAPVHRLPGDTYRLL